MARDPDETRGDRTGRAPVIGIEDPELGAARAKALQHSDELDPDEEV